jgi:hypothetical protein
MSDHLLANDPVRPVRRFPRRTDRIGPDRLTNLDMRSREGKRYRQAFHAASSEFPGADPARVAQIARLRLLAEREETDALAGRVKANDAVRAANIVARFERDLHLSSKGKPAASGAQTLSDYLATLHQDEDETEVAEVEVEIIKSRPLESSAADEHAAALADIVVAEPVAGVEP